MTVTATIGRDQPVAQQRDPLATASCATTTALAPARLATATLTAGVVVQAILFGHVPDAVLLRVRADHDLGDIAHIDRPVIAGRQQQETDVRHAGERLAGGDRARCAGVAHPAGLERAVGVAHLADELLQR